MSGLILCFIPKPFIDPKTAAKMIFITGDVSDGSANDKLLRELIGPNWKVLTGAEQPILQKTKPASSPGYLHSVHWENLMKRVEVVQEREKIERESRAITSKARVESSVASDMTTEIDSTNVGDLFFQSHVPEMYSAKEDDQRVVYKSQADFRNSQYMSEISRMGSESGGNFLSRDIVKNPVITAFLLCVEFLLNFLEEVFIFQRYLSFLFDSFLGPSTVPTKVFMRIALITFRYFHGGKNVRMRMFMLSYIMFFITMYFLFHDLRYCKRSVAKFVEQNAL